MIQSHSPASNEFNLTWTEVGTDTDVRTEKMTCVKIVTVGQPSGSVNLTSFLAELNNFRLGQTSVVVASLNLLQSWMIMMYAVLLWNKLAEISVRNKAHLLHTILIVPISFMAENPFFS